MQFGPKASVNRVNVYILQLKQEIEERASEREREREILSVSITSTTIHWSFQLPVHNVVEK